MARVKVNLISHGVKAVLLGEGLAKELRRRGSVMAVAARMTAVPPHEGKVDYRVQMVKSPTRSRALVIADHPAGLGQEAKYRILGRAVDAARD